jgi:hypothetical protein
MGRIEEIKSTLNSAVENLQKKADRPGPGGRKNLFRDASRLHVDDSVISAIKGSATRMDVLVGIQAEDNERSDDSPYTNAQLLYLLSRGSRAADIPPRPLVEPALRANSEEISEMLSEAAKFAQNGDEKALDKKLNEIGRFAVIAINSWFYDPANGWAPNAPSTIRQKGFDQPLIETEEMKDAISYRVIKHRGSSL